MTAPFSRFRLGWKASTKNKLRWPLVPNFADVDNPESMRIAAGVLDALGVPPDVASAGPEDPGGPLEACVRDHLASELPRLGPSRNWIAACGQIITKFDQYAHLSEVYE